MQSNNKTSINKMPIGFKIFLLLFSLTNIFLINFKINNDFYFLYPMGEYIVKNGFPTTDILSMHSDMSIIVQQWLVDVIYYYLYSNFGRIAISALLIICYLAIFGLIFKLCKTVSGNYLASFICTMVASMPLASMFITSRPQIFTYIILLIELNVLELFIKNGKKLQLTIIPILSIALVNMHCSMWMMIFVFMAPYLAATLPIKIKKLPKLNPDADAKSFIALLVTTIVSFFAGLANPYGTKAMTYVLTSFGYDSISGSINEMGALCFGSNEDNFVIIIAALTIAVLFFKKGIQNLRLDLLYLGTLMMALSVFKSSAYFFMAAAPAVAYALRDIDVTLKLDNSKDTNKGKVKKLALLFAIAVVVLIGAITYTASSQPAENKNNTTNAYVDDVFNYTTIDSMLDVIADSKEDVKLFTGFNYGAYVEYKGYHPYIDGRAELFLKDNNGKYDYLSEYRQLQKAKLYYEDFVDKYDFNYLIVSSFESYLYSSLENDDNYELIMKNDDRSTIKIALFAKKDNSNGQAKTIDN